MFIHLRTHTAYSLLEGAIPVKKLLELCKKNGMPAVAMTDTNNIFGALEFSLAAKKEGIQPILGAQISLRFPGSHPSQPGPLYSIVLLVQSEEGYKNLLKIVSHMYLVGLDQGIPQIAWADFGTLKTEGLMALSGGSKGPLNGFIEMGRDPLPTLQVLKELFPGRFYMELSRQGDQNPKVVRDEGELIELAYAHDIPLVATNETFFPTRDLFEAHDALTCIAEGTYVNVAERKRLTHDHYFKSQEEMEKLFEDLPEAIQNTVHIAKRCHFLLKPVDPIMPPFPCENGGTEEEELTRQARAGLEKNLHLFVLNETQDGDEQARIRKQYEDQLEYELGVIKQMGFPGYFLVVSDFIKWAKSKDIPVGPGRGSGAGSVVAWCLDITGLDPIRFGLVFERFLNPERLSMPDFDIDFCQDRRDEVIRYVRDKYGKDRVAHIITFGKLQARAVLRDVGRVLQMPYGQVDRLCKLVPNNPANPVTLGEALKQEPQLQTFYDQEAEVKHLIDISLQLEGLYRHASTHAAGVVIGDRPLDELVALYYDPRSPLPTTQFNMKYIEQAGLIKFDFLGLKTLTVIQETLNLLKKRDISIEIDKIPTDDPKTFELLCRGETVGIFQVESAGMTDVVRRLKPNRLEEIIALVALYRPGPMDNIPRFIACRHGEEDISYMYPELEPILSETFGVIVYQEQVLQIARDLAGYSLGSADNLRRAMGKKIKEEMDAQRAQFVAGVVERIGGTPQKATALFDQIDKFASYAFNKAHAAAYALISYQTAYLKTHYPVEYMAALMSLDMHNTDKLTLLAREVHRMEIPLLPPDVNHSDAKFKVEAVEGGALGVRYALAALKNVGEGAMETLQEERNGKGPFGDIFEFVERLDNKVLNKRLMENVVASGACDSLNPNRRQLFDHLDVLMRYGNSESLHTASLFETHETRPTLGALPDWSPLEKLRHEFAAVGFYLTGHPLDAYEEALADMGIMDAARMHEAAGRAGDDTVWRMAGVIMAKQERSSKKGSRFAFVQLSDGTGAYEMAVFSEILAESREILEPGRLVLVSVAPQLQDDQVRLTCQGIEDLNARLARHKSSLTLVVSSPGQISQIKELLKHVPKGRTDVTLEVLEPDRTAQIKLKESYGFSPEDRHRLSTFMKVG